jgi:hypothetical protein
MIAFLQINIYNISTVLRYNLFAGIAKDELP